MKDIDSKAKLIRDALSFAEEKHAGQVRKGSGSPYIHHPIMVSYMVANFKKSKNIHKLIAASILHDVVEDTDVKPEEIVEKFGMMISSLVFELTDDKEEIKRVGKLEYQKAKWPGLSSYGLFLKLCDRLTNVSDQPKETYKEDTLKILNHLEINRQLSKSQFAVANEIRSVING